MLRAVCQNTLPFHSHRKITARFDGGSLTSDAGWLLFGSVDRQHRLCEGFSSCISESRDQRYIRHDLLKLIRQRVLQIVAGYEDCNDADTLRSDPMLKTVCDQLPESDPDLATQPTFSRLENSVTRKDLMRLSQWLLGRYVRSLKKRRPGKIILDLDSTDDHTHGQQEFSFYHGYYRSHILHPLLIFDADTGDLVCAVLRPGNKGAASHIVPILKRVVEAIRQGVGTDVEIEIRADSGFATPRLYEFCEAEENQLQYVIGLSRNPRLQRVVEPLLDSTRERFLELEEKQRQFDEFLYRANSWDRSRRVIVKVEVDQRGINRRFVVTNRDDLCSQSLYDHYTNRGQTENFIKAFKNHLSMDRLSCHRFLANQFRLLLHALAYQMFVRLRDYLHGTPWLRVGNRSLDRRNRNLTSSCPQDRGPDPTNHSTHLGPSFLSLSRTTPLPPRLESSQLQLASPSSPKNRFRYSPRPRSLNQGPFPPPELPGFLSNTGLSATLTSQTWSSRTVCWDITHPTQSEIHSPTTSNASPTDILRKSACHTCPLSS